MVQKAITLGAELTENYTICHNWLYEFLEPGGRRFTMTVGYKAAGNDNIQYHVWQTGSDKDWGKIINQASPEQLTVLGFPPPGDKFWSLRTLKLTQRRWPELDMSTYFSAASTEL